MPEYQCKDCGAVWHGWGEGKVCPKCGGKLEPVPENTADKKQTGFAQGWIRCFPSDPRTLPLNSRT